ncbi:hypothetical protein MIR68_005393 [Amoeboaphelidium protococcarum]|nr:hypothetical protein MIR68_005393 [Amoeboaphelidium protococcarum]
MKQRVLSLNCICFWLSPLYLPADVASSSSCSSASQYVVDGAARFFSNNGLVVALTRCDSPQCARCLLCVSRSKYYVYRLYLVLSAHHGNVFNLYPRKTQVSTSTIIYGAQKIWPNGPRWYHGPQQMGATGPELTAW